MHRFPMLYKALILLFFLIPGNSLAMQWRLISTSPSITEIIKFFGDEKKLIGVSSFCKIKNEDVKVVGTSFAPNLEMILSLNPTHVFFQDVEGGVAQKALSGLNTSFLLINTLKDLESSIVRVGSILNKKKKALDYLKAFSKEDHEKTKKKSAGKGLIILNWNPLRPERLFVCGEKCLYSELLSRSGFENVLKSKTLPRSYRTINLEELLSLRPDFLLFINDKEIEDKKFWNKIGIKKKNIFLNQENFMIPGPKTFELLNQYEGELK